MKDTGSGTNNAPFNYKITSMQFCNNITPEHTKWYFRWNIQIKTINHYTHIVTLPTTRQQALLLLDPVFTREKVWKIMHHSVNSDHFQVVVFWKSFIFSNFIFLPVVLNFSTMSLYYLYQKGNVMNFRMLFLHILKSTV